MIWTPTRLFGKTVFIVGGGPSLRDFDFYMLHGRQVIAINEAYVDIPWADVLFFRDYEWYSRAKPEFDGVLVSVDMRFKHDERVQYIQAGTYAMPRARTGGQFAVSLAMLMGAGTIVLLGFDHNFEGGNYHDRHPNQGVKYTQGMIYKWLFYRDRANLWGCRILNATPDSRIDCFESITYEDMYLL